jgi:multiple sugar transport system substrate-binding protein
MGSMSWSRHVSRRRVLQAGILGSAAAVLAAACGTQQSTSGSQTQAPAANANAPAPSPTAAQMSAAAAATATALPIQAVQVNKSAGVVQLVYWNAWTGLFEDMVHRLVNSFNKSHDKIQVTPQVIPSADFDTKFLTAVTAGDPPDVAMLWNSTGRLYTMAEQGAVTPLEEVLDDPNKFKEWVLPYIWELGTYKGKLYGIPQWMQTYALMWNPDLFKAAGLDPEKGPSTTDELFQMAQKLTKKKSNGDIEVIGFWDNWMNRWMPGFGGKLIDESGSKVTANDPNNVKVLEWIVSFAKAYGPKKLADYNQQFQGAAQGTLDPLMGGKAAIYINGPWELGTIKRTAPQGFTYKVGMLPPGGPQPFTWTYGDIPVVPAGAKHKNESGAFVQYLTGFGGEDAYADLFINGLPHCPISKKIVDDGKFDKVIQTYPGYKTFLDTVFGAKAYLFPPKIPTAAYYDQRMRAHVDEAVLGTITPQEAMDKTNQEAQADLDKWFQTHKK